jgi:hypothetical protein
MKQEIKEKHDIDVNGNPVGGSTIATGIFIEWQNGPLGRGADRKEPSGAFVEGVIQAAIGRLEFYQAASDGKFACKANEHALYYLAEALAHLEQRTLDREGRRVEGTSTP